MTMIRKTFDIEVKEQRENGGRIVISTGAADRDKDRVFPSGGHLVNYRKNPVVQYGHNYREPWATIGRTLDLEITDNGIVADFELRPAANEHDPQNIVQLLWNGGWIRTASIGFNPIEREENELGGLDFTKWELLEWSLVPIPANQDALRLAAKAVSGTFGSSKTGDEKELDEPGDQDENVVPMVAWIRRLEVRANTDKEQMLFACFRSYSVDIPDDAEKLDFDENGELVLVPHPDAGKTLHRKDVAFVPPLEYYSKKWGDDVVYSIGGQTRPDEELIKGGGGEWDVLDMSEVLLSLPAPAEKAWTRTFGGIPLDICRLTASGVAAVKQMVGRFEGVFNPLEEGELNEQPDAKEIEGDDTQEPEELDAPAGDGLSSEILGGVADFVNAVSQLVKQGDDHE